MNKPKWLKKLKRKRSEKRHIKSEYIYHKHSVQVVVSEKELIIQLDDGFINDNLVACLAYGKAHPQYDHLLLMVSVKFRFLGSLCFPDKNSEYYFVKKPPRKEYEKRLFDNYLDCISDAEARLNTLKKEYGCDPKIDANELLKKYSLVKTGCMRMLTDSSEFYFASEYRDIIDYIANTDNPIIVFKDKYSPFPDLPNGYDNDINYGNFMK